MKYSFLYQIYKNYNNTILYLLLGILMLIILSQFNYIKNTIMEGFDAGPLNNQINSLKSQTEQIKTDTININNATKLIQEEVDRVRKNITQLETDINNLNSETQQINNDITTLRSQFKDKVKTV